MSDTFFEVARSTRETSAGAVELPILYREVNNVVGLFLGARAGAERVLEGTGLDPVVVAGRAVVGLSFYEYLRTSIGSYNEVGTAIFALRRGEAAPRLGLLDVLRGPAARTVGMCVVDLPVTTAAAHAAGREIWGYPKFVTEIPFRLDGRAFSGSVLDPDTKQPIVTLAGTMGLGVPVPPLGLMTYTLLDGALIRTHIDVRGATTLHLAGSMRLSVGASTHRMAENLRTLGLDGATPKALLRSDRFQSKLPAGEAVR